MCIKGTINYERKKIINNQNYIWFNEGIHRLPQKGKHHHLSTFSIHL